MRRALQASAGIHMAVLIWVAMDGSLFRSSPDADFEVTSVTLISSAEYEALAAPSPAPVEAAPIPQIEPLATPATSGGKFPPARTCAAARYRR